MRGYNALKMSVDELGKQTFRDFELIVVNNGSEYLTAEQVFLACRDNRISLYKYLFVPKLAQFEASKVMNTGISHARGVLCFFLHESVKFDYVGNGKSCDITFLQRLWDASESGTKMLSTYKYIYTGVAYGYNTDDVVISGAETVKTSDFHIQQDAVPRRYLRIVGGLDPVFDGAHGFVDFDLWNRVHAVGCKHIIEEGLVSRKYRIEASKLEKSLREGPLVDSGRNSRIYNERYQNSKGYQAERPLYLQS